MGYVCAILATLFTALNIVIMRKCSKIHYSTIIFNLSWYSLITAIFFFFLVSDNHEQKSKLPHDWITSLTSLKKLNQMCIGTWTNNSARLENTAEHISHVYSTASGIIVSGISSTGAITL